MSRRWLMNTWMWYVISLIPRTPLWRAGWATVKLDMWKVPPTEPFDHAKHLTQHIWRMQIFCCTSVDINGSIRTFSLETEVILFSSHSLCNTKTKISQGMFYAKIEWIDLCCPFKTYSLSHVCCLSWSEAAFLSSDVDG